MPSLKETKRRIKSVESIAKVTNAMHLLSAAKMKKLQAQTLKLKAYQEKVNQLMQNLTNSGTTNHLYFNPAKTVSEILLIIFATERGLAGSLPNSLYKEIQTFLKTKESINVKIINCGKKLTGRLHRFKAEVLADFSDMPENPTASDIRSILKIIENHFSTNGVQEVYLAYPGFINTMTQKIRLAKILPLADDQQANDAPAMEHPGLAPVVSSPELREKMNSHAIHPRPYGRDVPAGRRISFTYEPNSEEVLTSLIKLYLESILYTARVETSASEYSARMVAMKSANDSALEIKGNLTLEYNKNRQAQITQEIAQVSVNAFI